jgi:hypothetical protein
MHRRILLLLALLAGCATSIKQPTATITVVGGAATVPAGTLVQVDGSTSSDPQGLTLQFAWSLRNVPAGSKAALNSTSTVSPSFVADVSGSYDVALIVSDGVLSSTQQSITIVAAACGGGQPNVVGITFTQGATTATTAIALPPTDAGTDGGVDAGSSGDDAGTPDAGSGTSDAGAGDAGSVDAGSADAGATDAGAADAGASDAGVSDAGRADAGSAADAGTPEVFEQLLPIQLSSAIVDNDTNSGFCVPAAPAVYQYAWSLQTPAGSSAALSKPQAENPTFTPDVPGAYLVTLQVTDANGHAGPVVSAEVTVSACGDQPPVVSLSHASTQVMDGQSVVEGPAPQLNVPVTLTGAAHDPDNAAACDPSGTNIQTVTISWNLVSVPAGSHAVLDLTPSVGGAPAVPVTASLLPDVPGSYILTLGATDSTGLAANTHIITVVVAGCTGDHPPSVTAIQPENANGVALPVSNGNPQGSVGQAVEFGATVADVDNGGGCAPLQTFSYDWALIAQPAGSQAKLNNPASATPGLVLDAAGTYTVQLVATDSTGLASLPVTASLVATTPPSGPCGSRPPTITLNPQITGPISAPWKQVTQLLAINQLLPNGQNPGCGTGCTQVVTVNDPDQACVQNLSLSFVWSFDGLPPGSQAAFLNPDVQNASFIPDIAGANYLARLTVTDSRGLSTTADVQLHTPLAGANPPVVQFNPGVNNSLGFSGGSPPQLTGGIVGQPVSLNLGGCNNGQQQVTDADNSGTVCNNGTYGPQTFTYAWTMASAPAGSRATVLNPGSVSPSFVPDVQGNYDLRVVVSDSTGLSSSPADIVVVVNCGGAPPQIATVSGSASLLTFGGAVNGASPSATWNSAGVVTQGATIFELGAPITFQALGFDPNNVSCHVTSENLTYTWTLANVPGGSATTISSSGQTAILTPDTPATYSVTVVVSDASGNSQPTTFSFSVSNCNSAAPSLAANAISASGAADVGQMETFSVNQSAITDGNVTGCTPSQWRLPATYGFSWSLIRAPGGSTAQLQGTNTTSPTILPDVAGQYEVGLVVTDASGAQSVLAPGSGGAGTYVLMVGACGGLAPSALVGAADCGVAANSAICQASQNQPSSGAAPYNACGGATATNCLAPGPISVSLAAGHQYLLGSLTPPANFGCLPSDNWSSMTYQWQVLSAPAASTGGALSKLTLADATFRADVAGTYVIGLTVTNELGKSSTATISMVVQ